MFEKEKCEKQEKCADCGAYIDKINPVETYCFGKMEQYYCGKCKKPYTKVYISTVGVNYFAEVEVDEKGKPIK